MRFAAGAVRARAARERCPSTDYDRSGAAPRHAALVATRSPRAVLGLSPSRAPPSCSYAVGVASLIGVPTAQFLIDGSPVVEPGIIR